MLALVLLTQWDKQNVRHLRIRVEPGRHGLHVQPSLGSDPSKIGRREDALRRTVAADKENRPPDGHAVST